jgi:DNA-directed RNA polymerase specialized sigma24 family protein
MTTEPTLLPHFAVSTRHRLRRLALPPEWRSVPALSGFASVVDVLDAATASSLPVARRTVLSALLLRAPGDRLAAEVFMAALVPALRAVAADLARWALVELTEIDALVAMGAWEAICSLGGTPRAWPDRAVVCRARDFARDHLRAEARRRARETVSYEFAEGASTSPGAELDELFAADVLAGAVARGSINLRSARFVWALRIRGLSCAEVAELFSCSPEAVSMERLRAERALRAEVA